MEDNSEIVEFDARTLKILNRFPLSPGEEPTGLAFDPKQRKLFSTCPTGSWSSPTPTAARSSRRSRSAPAPTAASSTPRRPGLQLQRRRRDADHRPRAIAGPVRGRQDDQDPGQRQDDRDRPQDPSPLPVGRHARAGAGYRREDGEEKRRATRLRARIVRRRGGRRLIPLNVRQGDPAVCEELDRAALPGVLVMDEALHEADAVVEWLTHAFRTP